MTVDAHIIDNEEKLRAAVGNHGERTPMKVLDHIDEYSKKFIELTPLIFVGTSDSKGNLDVSPKGDPAGFVKVQDKKTLLIPERKGNRLLYGFRNMFENPRIGLIFVVPGAIETVRVNGKAVLTKDPDLLDLLKAQGQPALLCTVVTVEECFFHCGKAMIRSKVWDPTEQTDKAKSLMKEQLSAVMSVNQEQMNDHIDASYKNNLY